jgi:hypothetical protein
VRPSTIASAVQTQAEFDVRVASSGQVVTAIGITRHIPGRHREHAEYEPVRSAKDDRYQRDAAEIEAPEPVTAPSFMVSPTSDPGFELAVVAQKRWHAALRR